LGETNKEDVLLSLDQLFTSQSLNSADLPGIFQKLKLKETWVEEALITSKTGKQFWANLAASKFLTEGKELNLLRINDITERVKAEEQIKLSLHEKEILIQEIHHRVKNNMAVISSLLHLQSGYIEDSSLIDVFKDSQSRIKSMALIHEKLYQSKTLALVEFESYIRELTRTILYSYSTGNAKVKIETHVENIYLDINSAVPCGLIVNELLSNACKHAFKGREEGLIDVAFLKKDDTFHLSVKDDGVGLPEGFSPENAKSLGMTLVYALSSQLNATIEYISGQSGTYFQITFKEKAKKNLLSER
jgi:two-component sensor histidine kinase